MGQCARCPGLRAQGSCTTSPLCMPMTALTLAAAPALPLLPRPCMACPSSSTLPPPWPRAASCAHPLKPSCAWPSRCWLPHHSASMWPACWRPAQRTSTGGWGCSAGGWACWRPAQRTSTGGWSCSAGGWACWRPAQCTSTGGWGYIPLASLYRWGCSAGGWGYIPLASLANIMLGTR